MLAECWAIVYDASPALKQWVVVSLVMNTDKSDSWDFLTISHFLMGLVKLKKIKKSEKNSDRSDNTHPPSYPFFVKTFGNMKTTHLKNKK